MTGQDITELVGALGFPIILVGGMLWFFAVKMWPWFIARQERNDGENAGRHKAYLEEMAQTRQVYERTIAALERIIGKLDDGRAREKEEHEHILHEIGTLRQRPRLEPERDR